MFLRVFKISGHSMMPILNPNDKVIVSSIPYLFSKPKVGDVVVFKYKNKFMIKKIVKVDGKWYMVDGENITDTLEIPKLNRKDLLGKIITKI